MSEVEDFLKRVAQMRAEAQARGNQQKQPAQRQPPQPAPQRPPPPQRPSVAPRSQPVQAEIVEAELTERSERVARRVSENLRGAEAIAEHARHLGAEVDLADDKLEARLHEVFDHQLGRLSKSTSQAEPRQERPGEAGLTLDSIARLLRSPTSARDAVILAEIFQRPDQRW